MIEFHLLYCKRFNFFFISATSNIVRWFVFLLSYKATCTSVAALEVFDSQNAYSFFYNLMLRVTNYEKYLLFALFSQLFFDFLKVAEVRTKRLHSSLYHLTPEDFLLNRIDERLLERERKLEQARQNRIRVRNAS